MDPRQLYDQIKQGKISSLYFLYGEERFIIDELLQKLREAIVPAGIADLNNDRFYAGEHDPAIILEAVDTLPMMAPKRLVEVREVDHFSASEREKLIPLLEHPPETSVVVFVAESIDEREKFFKQLKKSSAVMVQARTPFEDKVPQWIQYIAKKFKKKIDDQGVSYLLKTVGSNLQDLKNEISKAAIYVGEESVITLEGLQTVASPLRETTIFDLTNAVGMGETKEAIQELQKLLTIGEPEPKILTMLVRQWRLIWRACKMLDHGNPPAVVTERLKVHKFFRAEFLNQCSQHDTQILRNKFPLFYETDLRLKRSTEDKRLALEELTLRLCQN